MVLGLLPAMLLAALDQTLISVALITIGRELRDISLAPWVMSGFLVASTVATPLYGKLSDSLGRRRMLSVAILGTAAGSVLCALAQSMPQLIAARVLQGLGSGGLLVLVQSVVADLAPGPARGRYQGYLSGVYAFAAVSGPLLGGFLTEYLSWRAVFWLNLPLALAALIWARWVLPPQGERRTHRLDVAGAVLLASGLSSLLIALTRIGQGHPLGDPMTLTLVGLAIGLLALTAWVETRAAEPLISPSHLRNRTVRLCCAITALQFFVLIGTSMMMPMAMQMLNQARPDDVALRTLPLTLGIPVGAFIGGRWLFRTGLIKTPLLIAALVAAAGALPFAIDPALQGMGQFLGLLVLGLGLGLSMAPSLVAAQSTVPANEVGVVTATAALLRTLGGAIGIALLSAILFAWGGFGETVPGDAPGGLRAQAQSVAAIAEREALMNGFRLVFGAAALVSVMGALLAFRLPISALPGRQGLSPSPQGKA